MNEELIQEIKHAVENFNLGFINEGQKNVLIMDVMSKASKFSDVEAMLENMISDYKAALEVVNKVKNYIEGVENLAFSL